MFTREKVRVDPARNNSKKGRKGKNAKAAWETLLTSSQNGTHKTVGNSTTQFGSEKRNGYQHVQWSDDDDDDYDGDDYDKYNTSITPNASLSFSGSHSKSFETLWRSATSEARANSSLSRSFESHQVPLEDFQVHTGQPPVPKEIVGQIREGKYVNFQELLPENLGKENAKNKTLIDETERVVDITKWVDCMAVYVTVFAYCYPNRIRDLLAYQGIITRLYRECQDKKAWQRYDVAFRRKASQNGLKDWSTVDENLWIMASSRDARRAVRCKACLSLAHDPASCPLKPKEEAVKTSRRHTWLGLKKIILVGVTSQSYLDNKY